MSKPSKFTRFDTFVGISVALHLLAVLAVVVFALLPRQKPPLDLNTFELIGNPPKGNDGGSASTPRPVPQAPVAAQEPPPPPTSKPIPKPPPVIEKAMPIPAEKSAKLSPDKSKPVPTTADAKPKPDSKSTTPAGDVQQGTTGKSGKEGRIGGDTLRVGGEQGVPSAMALWLSRVKHQVERNWRAPSGLAGVQQMPEVVFSVALDGRPSMAKLLKKSGNPTLDRLALRAVQSVETFPPVPSMWPEDKVVLRYVLQYAP
jgi:periplasmic protein TonB